MCEGIFRPRGPKATLLLTGPHRLIVSRGSAELPGRRVQWLSALPRDNGKNYLTLELARTRNRVEDMYAIVSKFQFAKIGVHQ